MLKENKKTILDDSFMKDYIENNFCQIILEQPGFIEEIYNNGCIMFGGPKSFFTYNKQFDKMEIKDKIEYLKKFDDQVPDGIYS